MNRDGSDNECCRRRIEKLTDKLLPGRYGRFEIIGPGRYGRVEILPRHGNEPRREYDDVPRRLKTIDIGGVKYEIYI